ncbi:MULTISPECIES: exonuclease domain-containing protein [unclassified Yoonia]|uniref:3'-5' exonuclease n=1 Tax=unclassified Yoonia TaxID=2629118 RepID=UPI002AFDF3E2|nr:MULTISPECIES: exonuclease domain-containing protein [unclassified Yoonia]
MFDRVRPRQRTLAFFALLAFACIGAVVGALLLANARLDPDHPQAALLTAGLLAGFAIFGICAVMWLVLDDMIVRPLERLTAAMQAHAASDMRRGIDPAPLKHLGDLAAAAAALTNRLAAARMATDQHLAKSTSKLTFEREQLTRILSAIPAAVLMVSPDHRITLYDGHAAMMLDDQHHLGLGQPVFDYFDETYLRAALDNLSDSRRGTLDQQVPTADGARMLDVSLHDLGQGQGYMLSFSVPRGASPARPVVFDFEMNTRKRSGDIMNRRLRDLTYVVFDTETTGFLPNKDEVVQIGALRLVNGQQAKGEVLDLLVNPGRPIPARSTAVHGINDAMVQDAPDMAQAGRKFHSFARDAVLVAHNAPFDLAFFHRHSAQIGAKFDNPVLDTVLLSAVLFGMTEGHTLDELCQRLGVELRDEHRHTAIGDATATRDVFLRMIPMLEARGLTTFGAVLNEIRKHKRLLPDLNG